MTNTATVPLTDAPAPRTQDVRRTLVKLAAIYVPARVLTFVLLYLGTLIAQPGSRFYPATIEKFTLAWDAQWYWWIAENGYPSPLPLTDTGHVAQNAWAFMPVYPWVSQVVGLPLGSWGAGASLVSLLSGFACCFFLYRLLTQRVSSTVALWSVAFMSYGPMGPLFHMGYAEALFMAMLLLSLDLVLRRQWKWLFLILPIMGFTRPGILPFALMLGLYGVWRWFRRDRDPLGRREIVQIVALGLICCVVGFAWQVIAGIVVGDSNAYLQTELSWRRNWVVGASDSFLPFDGWILALNFWFDLFKIPLVLGWVLFLALLGGFVWALVRSAHVKALGMELRLWSASYVLYLLAVFFPQSSTFRLLLPLTPLWGAVAGVRSFAWRFGTLTVCVVLQWIWIAGMLADATQLTQIP